MKGSSGWRIWGRWRRKWRENGKIELRGVKI